MSFNTATITVSLKSTRISVRNGVQFAPVMLKETVDHYLKAVESLEKGEFELGEEWQSRNEYPMQPVHDEAMVTIYRLDVVNVPTGGRVVPTLFNLYRHFYRFHAIIANASRKKCARDLSYPVG